MSPRILVLGAGIQGSCAALALAHAGYPITLLDRAPAPLLRTSIRNEGKIHLGLVYANDPTRRTGSRLLGDALGFGPLLETFLGGPLDWPALVSNPFVDPAAVAGAVATSELAVHQDGLRDQILAALEGHPAIEVRMDREIRAAVERAGGFLVEGETGSGEPWSATGDLLVNWLWDGRIPLDRELGLAPEGPWVHRLEFRVLARLPEGLRALSSLTMVLGPYGDLVNYPGDKPSYLGWYPACLRGFSVGDAPPAAWLTATSGRPSPE